MNDGDHRWSFGPQLDNVVVQVIGIRLLRLPHQLAGLLLLLLLLHFLTSWLLFWNVGAATERVNLSPTFHHPVDFRQLAGQPSSMSLSTFVMLCCFPRPFEWREKYWCPISKRLKVGTRPPTPTPSIWLLCSTPATWSASRGRRSAAASWGRRQTQTPWHWQRVHNRARVLSLELEFSVQLKWIQIQYGQKDNSSYKLNTLRPLCLWQCIQWTNNCFKGLVKL